MTGVAKLARFSLTSADPARLADFYQRALGFRSLEGESAAGSLVLGLGDEVVELRQMSPAGRPYPADVASSDLAFQHLAIVVDDMAAAYAHLLPFASWRPITQDGPQRLPETSGGVEAFKFRDPEGHPLELLAFPEGRAPAHWRARRGPTPFLGIDHSAISVADTAASVAFYEKLGLRVAARSLNHGPEQARLDGLAAPVVEVTALAPPQATPHLELLCYRATGLRRASEVADGDIAATRLIFESAQPAAETRGVDPDGHRYEIVAPR